MDTYPSETFEQNLLPEFPNYHICENGDLFTNRWKNKPSYQWIKLKPHVTPSKRIRFSLSRPDFSRIRKYAEELIAMAYLNIADTSKFIISHKNKTFSDCRLENIETIPLSQKFIPIDSFIDNIPNYEGYFASKDGRIFSRLSHTRGSAKYWVELRQKETPCGYMVVKLQKPKRTNRMVHRLVVLAHLGEIPEGMQVCHNDGNKRNNKVENLRIDTAKNNSNDKKIHMTQTFGENHCTAKLTTKDVEDIFSWIERERPTRKEIAERYNVTVANINAILSKKTWTHIQTHESLLRLIKDIYFNKKLSLDKEKALQIHLMAESGECVNKIADVFGVKRLHVRRVLAGERWPKVKIYFQELKLSRQGLHLARHSSFEKQPFQKNKY